MFECGYGIGSLTEDMDIFQEIKTGMEDAIEENPYNLLFNTNYFFVEVKHRNMWPYTEYFLETIHYKRTGSFQRLECFRTQEVWRSFVNSSRIEQESEVLSGIDQINQESEGEIEEEEPKINTEQTFKSDECVICLTNPPNVLFCNCGHIAICVECDVVKGFYVCSVCPIYKTENTIKRTI